MNIQHSALYEVKVDEWMPQTQNGVRKLFDEGKMP